MENQIIIKWEDDGEASITYEGNAGKEELRYIAKKLYPMLKNGKSEKINVNKKCDNCSKYFIPKTKDTEIYCEGCRQIGYINKIKNDRYLKAYNTAYKTKHAQMQRLLKTDKYMVVFFKISLEKWRNEAKSKLKLLKEGRINETNFQSFLNLKIREGGEIYKDDYDENLYFEGGE